MTDPFAAALDVLFTAAGSAAAEYQAPDGSPVPVRVITWTPDQDVPVGSGSVRGSGKMLDLRLSEVADPVEGATITMGAEAFEIIAEPELDSEGLTWRCEVAPVIP